MVDAGGPYRYRAEVLNELARHGARPTRRTRPQLVHEFVSDLYRHELRSLRARLVRKEFPKKEYAARVIELRTRYRLISIRTEEWLDDG